MKPTGYKFEPLEKPIHGFYFQKAILVENVAVQKTTKTPFITDPLKFVGRTNVFATLWAKPQEGFAKEGRTKNPFVRLPCWLNDNASTIAIVMDILGGWDRY